MAQAPPQGQATGSAGQTPINGSGIQSELLFLDTGSDMNGLVVLFRLQKTGTAYVPLSEVATVSIRKVTPGMNRRFLKSCRRAARSGVIRTELGIKVECFPFLRSKRKYRFHRLAHARLSS